MVDVRLMIVITTDQQAAILFGVNLAMRVNADAKESGAKSGKNRLKMKVQPDLFSAMEAFEEKRHSMIFSANEVALFHALLHLWNKARRPDQFQHWADELYRRAGLKASTGPAARDNLVNKGVIFFHKEGNRGVPNYSFNALFGFPSPFLLSKNESKSSVKAELTLSKGSVNPFLLSKNESKSSVKAESYQDKDKDKEKDKGKEGVGERFSDSQENFHTPADTKETLPPRSAAPPSLPDMINSLSPDWENMRWTVVQGHELLEVQECFEDYPFDLVQRYLKTVEAKFRPKRSTFIADQGRGVLARAKAELGEKIDSGPSWLPDNWREIASRVTGSDCSQLRDWSQIDPDYKLEFQQECKKHAA